MKISDSPRKRNNRLLLVAVIACVGIAGWALRFVPSFLDASTPAYADGLSPSLMKQIVSGPDVPVGGNPVGAVTVVEFFDYRCPYCRMMLPRLQALVAHDRRVHLVYKEWPIFGGVSVEAARMALAAQWQGKYFQAHEALFALPRNMDDATIRKGLSDAGIDMARLDKDLATHAQAIDAQLATNDREAQALGLQGTPGFIIGKAVLPGALTEAQLKRFVDQTS